jgi:1,4-dihydroxy-2-naphthoyl-CoA synthase
VIRDVMIRTTPERLKILKAALVSTARGIRGWAEIPGEENALAIYNEMREALEDLKNAEQS